MRLKEQFIIRLKRSILFLLFSISSLQSFAEYDRDTLKIRQAFDWEIRDSLAFAYFEGYFGPVLDHPNWPWTWTISGSPIGLDFRVTGKKLHQDTLEYSIRWYNGVNDTIKLNNIDSPVTKFSYSVLYSHFLFTGQLFSCECLQRTPTCDSSIVDFTINPPVNYVNDSLASTSIDYTYSDTIWKIRFTQQLGLRLVEFNWPMHDGMRANCGVWLAGYKNDSTTWGLWTGIPTIEGRPDAIKLFPNPTSDIVNIVTPIEENPLYVEILDISGRYVLGFRNPMKFSFI